MTDLVTVKTFAMIDRRLRSLEMNEQFGGSSFPTSPASNVPFYRTDLGWACYYDGTQWLTAHEYVAHLAINPVTTTVTNANLRTVSGHDQYALYVTRAWFAFFVSTTNNGSNYWTWAFQAQNASFGATTTLDTSNTSANGAGSWNTFDRVPATTQSPGLTNSRFLNLSVTTTGAPGQLSCIASMSYRLIVT